MNDTKHDMIECTIYVNTTMCEVRTLRIPADLPADQYEDYAESHGYGDCKDIIDELNTLDTVEDSSGTIIWTRPTPDTTKPTI